jgi:hypothetical protein
VGPVTVVGTGNTPLNQIQGVSPRDYFFDASLPVLNTTQSNITSDVSPIASTSFASQFGAAQNGTLTAAQTKLLKSQIEVAHHRGIKVRYWDQVGITVQGADWMKEFDADSCVAWLARWYPQRALEVVVELGS